MHSWLPNGGAGSPNGLTEGVLFDEWQQLRVTDDTPFAAIAALPPEGAARGRLKISLPLCGLRAVHSVDDGGQIVGVPQLLLVGQVLPGLVQPFAHDGHGAVIGAGGGAEAHVA